MLKIAPNDKVEWLLGTPFLEKFSFTVDIDGGKMRLYG